MWKYLPPDGRANLAEDVLGCSSNVDIKQLADSVVSGLLNPMQAFGGQTAQPTPSPRFGLEDSIDNLECMLGEPVTRNDQNVLRAQCLRRDGNMCIVSNFYNIALPDPSRPMSLHARLQAAHILPFSLGMFRNNDERCLTASVWVNIYRYFPALRSRLNFENHDTNSIQNMLILTEPLHRDFRMFNFALEGTNIPDQYRIKKFHRLDGVSNLTMPSSGVVTLTCHDPQYPLPDPILLSIHAAISNILNATGRGEVVDKIIQDYNTTKVLARDGSTDISQLLSISTLSLFPSKRRDATQKEEF